MENKTQTFIVERDGEIDTQLSVLPPTALEAAADRVQSGVRALAGNIALQARMATFDALHGTHYRHIRNELVAQKRREEFERSIGLVAIDQK